MSPGAPRLQEVSMPPVLARKNVIFFVEKRNFLEKQLLSMSRCTSGGGVDDRTAASGGAIPVVPPRRCCARFYKTFLHPKCPWRCSLRWGEKLSKPIGFMLRERDRKQIHSQYKTLSKMLQ